MTDERLCARCGHSEGVHYEKEFRDLEGRPTSEPYAWCGACVLEDIGEAHPFEAAPSTDEGEARPPGAFEITWNRMLGGYRVSIPMYGGGWVVPLDELAAICAPLEERIAHLERLLRDLHAAGEVDGRNALVAENERLREALIWMSGSSEFGPGQPAHDHWVEIRDTLLFPPSSTEATKEGDAG